MARYTHVFDFCFEVNSTLNEDEIFNRENLPALLKAARQRLRDIEFLGNNTEAFGLVDTYEDDIPEDCERESWRPDLNTASRR